MMPNFLNCFICNATRHGLIGEIIFLDKVKTKSSLLRVVRESTPPSTKCRSLGPVPAHSNCGPVPPAPVRPCCDSPLPRVLGTRVSGPSGQGGQQNSTAVRGVGGAARTFTPVPNGATRSKIKMPGFQGGSPSGPRRPQS